MSRKKEYVLLVILGVIFLAAGGYLFQVWEDYREASTGYQKLKKFIIEKPDVEKDAKGKPKNRKTRKKICRRSILTGFGQ